MKNPAPSFAKILLSALLSAALATSGCYAHRGGSYYRQRGGNPIGWIAAAFVTAAIISTIAPPPARVVVVPEPRRGYSWQPGYWSRAGDDWEWIDGQWIELPPNYEWSPTHWEQAPDGTWHLLPGRWERRR